MFRVAVEINRTHRAVSFPLQRKRIVPTLAILIYEDFRGNGTGGSQMLSASM